MLNNDWRRILSPEYIPEPVMFRENQLAELAKGIQDESPCGKVLEGEKSTGKSTTLKKHLEIVSQIPGHAVLYMCTITAPLTDFTIAIQKPLGRKLYYRENAFHALQYLQEKHIHFGIDDTQNVVERKRFSPFLKELYEKCVMYDKALHLYCAGTKPYPSFLERIETDVQSRYKFQPVFFPYYDAVEIKDILKQRLEKIGIEYDPGAISFISTKIKALSSDLRLGLDVVKSAIEISQGMKPISPEVIEMGWNKTKVVFWKQQLRAMDEAIRTMLFAVTAVAQVTPIINETRTIRVQQILTYYRSYCKREGIEPVYKQRASYFLKRLEESDWITFVTTASHGRYGLDTEYAYEMNPDTVMSALKELDYNPLESVNDAIRLGPDDHHILGFTGIKKDKQPGVQATLPTPEVPTPPAITTPARDAYIT